MRVLIELHEDIDIQESIVECEDFKGMLIEFVEINKDYFTPDIVLEMLSDLLNKGEHRIDQGNGAYASLKLVKWSAMSDREEAEADHRDFLDMIYDENGNQKDSVIG